MLERELENLKMEPGAAARPGETENPAGLGVFAGGLLVGTVLAGSLVAGALDRKAKRQKDRAGNIFFWPALFRAKGRSRKV